MENQTTPRRSIRIMSVVLILLACSMLVLIVGLVVSKRQKTVHSSLGTTVGGREIKASIDGPAFIQPQGDAAAITFGSHKVRVEKERLLLDDKETAKIPASATNVSVVIVAATLTVTADSGHIVTTNITR